MNIEDKETPASIDDNELDQASGGGERHEQKVQIAGRTVYTAKREPATAKMVAPTPGIEGVDIGSGA